MKFEFEFLAGPEKIDYFDLVKAGWSRKRGSRSFEDDSIQKIDAQNILLSPSYRSTEVSKFNNIPHTLPPQDLEF